MKKIIILLMTAGIMLTGCSTKDTALKTINSTDKTAKISEIEVKPVSDSSEEESACREINTENKDGFSEGYGIKVLEEKQYTWQEYTITLPEEWVGRCIMEENPYGFSIYQKASYEKDITLGYICGFFRTQEPVEYDHRKTVIAYTEDGVLYYLIQPADVPCDTEDDMIAEEYIRMCQQVPQLKTSLQINVSGIHGNADEYMLSTSSIFKLEPEVLSGLTDNTLWIARNEIYARHGRQFANTYLQQYFNRCTWYKGEIPPQEFQENVLNQTEKDNLQLLAEAEKEYARQHPYPKIYPAWETVSEDLNHDGMADEITYQVTEQENGESLCIITINGEAYNVGELSYSKSKERITNPSADCFFISDILESDSFLEIAVLDEGESEDPVTYFFQYNGTLFCIGQVPGVPFDKINGGLNGFNGLGNITGQSRIDLIETAYLQNHWWYDGTEIIELDIRWHELLPSFGHVLYEDLPVYCEWDETSAAAVIPAQEEVFFLGTDAKQWFLVKGKDGSQGYMLVEDGNIEKLNKPAQEVFSGLQFSD